LATAYGKVSGQTPWLRNSREAMHTEEIRHAVNATIESIAPEAGVKGIRPDAPLREQVDLDSMDWMNVVAALQERFGVGIPESDYARLDSVDAMIAYVSSRLPESAGAPPSPAAPVAAPLAPTSHRVRGCTVRVRPMRREDLPMEAEFVRHLSSDARYKRFMLTLRELSPAKLKYLTDVDQDRHVALVATVDRDGHELEVGVARYIVDPAGRSGEFAIAVDDEWQGSGLAGILMHALIDVARARGLAAMEGIVLRSNGRMLRFARQLGFQVQPEPDDPQTIRVVRALR
jgi:acetyltransferase